MPKIFFGFCSCGMFHRPKPGETEEDLLEFQKQFLTEKLPPSASITKNAGDKRTADRDVVQLHGNNLTFI